MDVRAGPQRKMWKWNLLTGGWFFATPWTIQSMDSLGQNTGLSSCSLLQGIVPTQGINPGLPYCRQLSLPTETPGKPKEGWAPKNWHFWTVVLDKSLESPLDCKETKPVNPKGNPSWMFIGRTDAEAKTPILWQPDAKYWLIGKDLDAGKDWRQEKRVTEGEMVGWHPQLNGYEFEQVLGDSDGQRSLVCSSPWCYKESDTTEQLKNNDWLMLEDVLVCDVCTQNYLRYWGINFNELSKKYIFVLFFKFEIILKLKKNWNQFKSNSFWKSRTTF